MDINFKYITGTWLHSHEEDTADSMVYRHADYAFPPSRGRNGYEFQKDYTGTYIGIAARDGSTSDRFTWRVSEDVVNQVMLIFGNGVKRVLTLSALNDDRLVVATT